LFTALAFAGALYAVVLRRKALQLQEQQMTKEIGEVREQTNLLADRL
jgi:DNA repair exonuclease SbcCD ATPase subunit